MGTLASSPSSKPKCSFVRRKRPGWNRCEGSIVTLKCLAGDSGRLPTTDNVWRADAPSRDPGRTLDQTSRGARLSSKGVQMSSVGTRTCRSLFNPIAIIVVNSNNVKVPDTHSSRARYWEGSVVVAVNHLSVTCKVNQVNCTTVRLGLTTRDLRRLRLSLWDQPMLCEPLRVQDGGVEAPHQHDRRTLSFRHRGSH